MGDHLPHVLHRVSILSGSCQGTSFVVIMILIQTNVNYKKTKVLPLLLPLRLLDLQIRIIAVFNGGFSINHTVTMNLFHSFHILFSNELTLKLEKDIFVRSNSNC